MNNSGFSLIELLVVVAIIAILSAIALPLYSQYQARVQVNQALTTAEQWLDTIATQYQSSGVQPATFKFGSNTITAGSGVGVTINSGGIYQIQYQLVRTPNSSGAHAGPGVAVLFSLPAITGIPAVSGYCTPSTAGSCMFTIAAIFDASGAIDKYCGYQQNLGSYTGASLPPSWPLPPSCNCTNLGTFWNNAYTNNATAVIGGGGGLNNC